MILLRVLRHKHLWYFVPGNSPNILFLILWYKGQKVIFVMLAWQNMTLGPAKHEKVAIFRRKMSGFRMFSGFREHKVRRNPCIIGVKIPFDPNVILFYHTQNCAATFSLEKLRTKSFHSVIFADKKRKAAANAFFLSCMLSHIPSKNSPATAFLYLIFPF